MGKKGEEHMEGGKMKGNAQVGGRTEREQEKQKKRKSKVVKKAAEIRKVKSKKTAEIWSKGSAIENKAELSKTSAKRVKVRKWHK